MLFPNFEKIKQRLKLAEIKKLDGGKILLETLE